jgi:hypothetical protein
MLNYFQSVESKIVYKCSLVDVSERTDSIFASYEAEDRGSRKSVGVKKRGT